MGQCSDFLAIALEYALNGSPIPNEVYEGLREEEVLELCDILGNVNHQTVCGDCCNEDWDIQLKINKRTPEEIVGLRDSFLTSLTCCSIEDVQGSYWFCGYPTNFTNPIGYGNVECLSSDCVVIHELFVEGSHRRNGAGRAITRVIEDFAIAGGFEDVLIFPCQINGSADFYRRLSYRERSIDNELVFFKKL